MAKAQGTAVDNAQIDKLVRAVSSRSATASKQMEDELREGS